MSSEIFKTCARIITLGSDVNETLEKDFLKLLFEDEEYNGKYSKYLLFCEQDVYKISTVRLALNRHDDKRIILHEQIHTAQGNFRYV